MPYPFSLLISLAINNEMNIPLGCLSQDSAWNMCPIIYGIYIFLHGIFTRDVTKPYPLGEHHPWCSKTPITNKVAENKTYFP